MSEDLPPIELVTEEGERRRFHLHRAFEFEGRPHYLVEALEDPDEVMVLRELDGALEPLQGAELEAALDSIADELEVEEGEGEEA